MKKLFALLLALMMVLSLAACGGGGDDKTPSNEDKTPSSSQQQQQTQTSKPDESKPVESQQSNDSQPSGEEKSPAEKAEETAAGFGSFNGQPIVWRVLTVDVLNSKALLITKDCLDKIPFHGEETENLTWETSDLRAWLGGEFYDTAFTDEQKGKILEVVNPADTNSESGIQGGNDTTDKVFVLSESEMEQYFPDNDDMVSLIGDEELGYWTRTPGSVPTNFVCTNSYGGLFRGGNQATNATVAVRPAIWVNLSDEQADPVEDEPEQTPDDGGEASLDNVTDSNYAALAKELFGIDVDPEGDWELVKAESTGTIGGGMGIVYQGSATVDSKELMKAYYEATADISTAGICIGQADSISEPFADFEAFFEEGTKARGSVGEWIYEYGGKKIELMFALSPEMELTITIDFLADNKYS